MDKMSVFWFCRKFPDSPGQENYETIARKRMIETPRCACRDNLLKFEQVKLTTEQN
jgi:hypothetical protein